MSGGAALRGPPAAAAAAGALKGARRAIPGSGTTAILLGALIAYGIQPGPMLYIDEPEVFWAVIVSMWIGNVVLLILNLPLIPYIAKILTLPGTYLLPLILFFCIIGVYFVSFNTFDIYLMIAFACAAVMFRLLGFPMPPLILGFILGGMMEENLTRALLIWDDSWAFLWQRPLTLGIMLIALIMLCLPLWRSVQRRDQAQK